MITNLPIQAIVKDPAEVDALANGKKKKAAKSDSTSSAANERENVIEDPAETTAKDERRKKEAATKDVIPGGTAQPTIATKIIKTGIETNISLDLLPSLSWITDLNKAVAYLEEALGYVKLLCPTKINEYGNILNYVLAKITSGVALDNAIELVYIKTRIELAQTNCKTAGGSKIVDEKTGQEVTIIPIVVKDPAEDAAKKSKKNGKTTNGKQVEIKVAVDDTGKGTVVGKTGTGTTVYNGTSSGSTTKTTDFSNLAQTPTGMSTTTKVVAGVVVTGIAAFLISRLL